MQDIHDVKIETTLTVMKPIHAKWVIGLYDRLRNDTDLIKKELHGSRHYSCYSRGN